MKLKKKKNQSVDTLPLLRIESKTYMEGGREGGRKGGREEGRKEGVIETKCGVETEEMTIQRLIHLGDPSHQIHCCGCQQVLDDKKINLQGGLSDTHNRAKINHQRCL
jgi:hypothetical protein